MAKLTEVYEIMHRVEAIKDNHEIRTRLLTDLKMLESIYQDELSDQYKKDNPNTIYKNGKVDVFKNATLITEL